MGLAILGNKKVRLERSVLAVPGRTLWCEQHGPAMQLVWLKDRLLHLWGKEWLTGKLAIRELAWTQELWENVEIFIAWRRNWWLRPAVDGRCQWPSMFWNPRTGKVAWSPSIVPGADWSMTSPLKLFAIRNAEKVDWMELVQNLKHTSISIYLHFAQHRNNGETTQLWLELFVISRFAVCVGFAKWVHLVVVAARSRYGNRHRSLSLAKLAPPVVQCISIAHPVFNCQFQRYRPPQKIGAENSANLFCQAKEHVQCGR